MIKLLIDESPLIVLPSLAERIGLDEAIVLQQVHYLVGMSTKVENSQAYKDGCYWVFNSIDQWQSKHFRWWAVPTVKRIFQSLTESHLLIASAFGGGKSHKRLWYRVNHYLVDELAKLPASDFLLSRNDRIKMIKSIRSYQNESIGLDQNDLMNREVWDQNDLPTIYKNSELKKEFQEKEGAHPPLVESNLNSEDPNTQLVASLITKTESSVKQITPHGDGCSARPLQNIYAQAANVWELVDLCLDSPDLADAKPPSELLAVYNEKYKWSQWRWPWRSLTKTKEFGTFNPEVVKKLATQLAVKDKATPAQKYDWAIATINLWEQTKGGWTNLMTYCDRPVDQVSTESAEELAETPRHIKGWHDSYHEILHEKFRAARSLEVFFAKDKDNKPWYEFAKEKFPSWDWSK
jgi:hypothetical protein